MKLTHKRRIQLKVQRLILVPNIIGRRCSICKKSRGLTYGREYHIRRETKQMNPLRLPDTDRISLSFLLSLKTSWKPILFSLLEVSGSSNPTWGHTHRGCTKDRGSREVPVWRGPGAHWGWGSVHTTGGPRRPPRILVTPSSPDLRPP